MNYSIFGKRANKRARDQLDVFNSLIKKWAENDEPTIILSLQSRERYKQTSEIGFLTDLLQTKDNSLISFINLKLIKHQTNLNIPLNLNILISYQYLYIFQHQYL